MPTKESIILSSKTFAEFKKNLAHLSTKEKGDAFELLTKLFLMIEPKYSTTLESVYLYSEIPSSVQQKLNLPLKDHGIDLLAVTHNGEYWSIQCKYREDENIVISHEELSTFGNLSFVICKEAFVFGLVCTTTSRYSKLYEYQNKIGFCTSEIWNHLDEHFFQKAHSLLTQSKIIVKDLKEPRKYQQRAIRNSKKHFVREGNARGKMIMPCGTGKSLTSYWIAESLNAKNILISVPSLVLLRQSLNLWLEESSSRNLKVNWLCVCSDDTIADNDSIIVNTQDLGIPISTDIQSISEWLIKTKTNENGINLLFTTYQSGKIVASSAKITNYTFDLGIFDEAHKTVGTKDKLFSHLLFEDNVNISKRIFMTATERRYAGNSDEIVSMDDYEIYGDTFELLTFKEAIEEKPKILCDYSILTIAVLKSEIKELIQKNIYVNPQGDWDEEVESQILASVIALRKAMKKYSVKHAISFHGSILRAEKYKKYQELFNSNFSDIPILESFHVSGKMSTSYRDKIINEFKNSNLGLITNAKCLTEGVDIPDIDSILFADPRKSTIDIIQAVGRALRPSKEKENAFIIIPLIIDDNNPNSIFESEDFKDVLMTLRALASNDERIIEYFRAISQKKRKTGKRSIFNLDIDITLSKQIDLGEFADSIELKCWSRLAKLSWMPFDEARKFIQSLGLTSNMSWRDYCNGKLTDKVPKPPDIPYKLEREYKDKGWISWGDVLGTGRVADNLRKFKSFEEAISFVRALNLKSQNEWKLYCTGQLEGYEKKPSDIPTRPYVIYKEEGWVSFGHWLGTGTLRPGSIEYLSFEKAREYIHGLKLKSQSEWFKYCRNQLKDKQRPENIPTKPYQIYKDKGWINWGDWLGTGSIYPGLMEYLPYSEAKAFVHALKINSAKEWNAYCAGKTSHLSKKPSNIPANARAVYQNKGWIDWGDWLGTGRSRKKKL